MLNTCKNIKRGTLVIEDAAMKELQWTDLQYKSSSNNRESSQSPWKMPMNSPWKDLPLPCTISFHSLHTHTEQREDEREMTAPDRGRSRGWPSCNSSRDRLWSVLFYCRGEGQNISPKSVQRILQKQVWNKDKSHVWLSGTTSIYRRASKVLRKQLGVHDFNQLDAHQY